MPKTFHRTDRVSAQIRRDLGTLVHAAVREHGLPSVSVSDVEVTRDMAHAKVFVTALMPEEPEALGLLALMLFAAASLLPLRGEARVGDGGTGNMRVHRQGQLGIQMRFPRHRQHVGGLGDLEQ